MKRMILCAVAMLFAVGAMAQENDTPQVVVNGYAERMITPNKFTIAITITEKDTKGRVSLDSQERDMVKALKAAGFETEALRLENNYSTYNRRGALATRIYELTVIGAEDLDKAFATLEPLNLHTVHLKKATCTDLGKIREELRQEAIRDAKRNAQVLAEAIDQQIGACIYIHDYNSNGDVVFPTNGARKMRDYDVEGVVAVAYAAPATMEYAEQKLSHTVQAKFRLL